jgi:hypothetical protein
LDGLATQLEFQQMLDSRTLYVVLPAGKSSDEFEVLVCISGEIDYPFFLVHMQGEYRLQ